MIKSCKIDPQVGILYKLKLSKCEQLELYYTVGNI
jgi:hypothetical protein